ncbi:helix-turn-helix domain-containing protein [Actinacidiphila glaucinigra]|uniref:helix-turn-helix domain-containing protein n=1 Tax=Actinacidiphila glaucinigra TaxID=235986 RepID=UPI0035E31D25
MTIRRPRPHLTGLERRKFAAELKAKYEAGASIRDLVQETNRSYGYVHRLLDSAGVTFRPRGGVKARRAAL